MSRPIRRPGTKNASPAAAPRTPADALDLRPALITGGAGFVATNVAARLMDEGRRVVVFDDLSRPGANGTCSGCATPMEIG